MAELQLQGGGALEYDDRGRGTPVVFVHGWSMCRDCFQPQLVALSDTFRVIVPDLRAHGNSSPLPPGAGIDTLAVDLGQLLSALDLRGSIVVGWSMGAMVTWATALGPEARRIAGIVSVDMVPRLLNDTDWNHGLREGRDASAFAAQHKRMRDNWPEYVRRFVPKIFARARLAEFRIVIARITAKALDNDSMSMAALWRSMADADFRSALRSLRVPTLIIQGGSSELYDVAAGEWMANAIPDAQLAVFGQSGHAPHLEEPERFNDAIRIFAGYVKQRATGKRNS